MHLLPYSLRKSNVRNIPIVKFYGVNGIKATHTRLIYFERVNKNGFTPYGFIQKATGIFVNPQAAKIVQIIYQRCLASDSLERHRWFSFSGRIPSPQGKERWTCTVLSSLLSNQKYVSYIIDFDVFLMVQGEKEKRSNIDEDTGKRKAARYRSRNVLIDLLACAKCGANYRRISRLSGEALCRSTSSQHSLVQKYGW